MRLSIVPDTVLTAGGKITLVAHQNTESPVVEPGKEFDAVTGVDPGTETITLSADHGLADGATITYQTRGGTPVGGLTNGGRYNVLVVSPNSLQLGSSFDAAQVDADTDTIFFGRDVDGVFVPLFHNLTEGQRVIYSMPGGGAPLPGLVDGRAYSVRIVDDYRVQLVDTTTPLEVPFGAGDITGGNTITENNSYTDGQAVQYVAPKALGSFTSTRVDIVVDVNGAPIPLPEPATGYQTADNNRIAIRNHGFTTGQQVMYRAAGGAMTGLSNNVLYYVIRISDHEIQLADTLCRATGTCPDGDDLIPVTPLPLTPDVTEAGREILHQLFAPGQQPISGLENGERYYIVGSHGDVVPAGTHTRRCTDSAGGERQRRHEPLRARRDRPRRRHRDPPPRDRSDLGRVGYAGSGGRRRRPIAARRRGRQRGEGLRRRRRLHRLDRRLARSRTVERDARGHRRRPGEGHRRRRCRRERRLERRRIIGCLDRRSRLHRHRLRARAS